jgi:phenol/toluene 2-monooxygenase (NADH) P1/A1
VQVDIKSMSIKPLRNTFGPVARFTGSDKAASRYLEATIGIQSEVNFHYRPMWAKDRDLYDKRNTAIVMNDWYRLLDPRQYYYGAWAIARSKQQDAAERNFSFVEKRGLLSAMSPAVQARIAAAVLPLRHLEYAANLNNSYITGYGYGVSITQATMMCAMDRLGLAQYISRIGLLLDGNSGTSLHAAKAAWQNDAAWQPLRKLAENHLVTKDWFELFVAQNVVLDGLVYPLIYQSVAASFGAEGATGFAMLTEFMSEWFDEHVRWCDQVMKIAAAESAGNKALLTGWVSQYQNITVAALMPLAEQVLGKDAKAAMDSACAQLAARLKKSGL